MTPVASIGTAPVRGASATALPAAPEQPQGPLERLLAEPGPLDRLLDAPPVPHRADADHGAVPLR